MKKFLAMFFVLFLVVAMVPGMAAAEGTGQDDGLTETIVDPDEDGLVEDGLDEDGLGEEDPEEEEDFGKILLPDSPFYFLKRFVEGVRVLLTFNEGSKTELLADLAEERARELRALEEKYADQELTEEQIEMLGKAAEDLIKTTGDLYERLISGEDLEGLELTDEDIAKLEQALLDMGEAIDWLGDYDDDDDEGNYDKYERRIAHLEQIREQTPETANKGLDRAIENARRQQERWLNRTGGEDSEDPVDTEDPIDPEDPVDPEEPDEDDENLTSEGTEEGNGNGKGEKVKKDRKDKIPPGHLIRDKVRKSRN